MNNILFFRAGYTAALDYAEAALKRHGYLFSNTPCENVTHLLLPVPSFESDGSIKGGGNLEMLLKQLPTNVTIIGGNLDRSEFQAYKTIDLLQDSHYLAYNANITAHCAIKLAMKKLPITLTDCPVLVIGWGRIGKCLSQLLKQLGAKVTIAARKEDARAMASALGYKTVDISEARMDQYRLIYNTAPTMLYPHSSGTALKIDLASKLGLGGLDVIWARGLPGKDAPESSGELIASTVMHCISRKENEP